MKEKHEEEETWFDRNSGLVFCLTFLGFFIFLFSLLAILGAL